MKEKVGILHPGDMGTFLAVSARNSGCAVYWASEGRSPKTRERAEKHGLIDTSSLLKLCETCSVIVSVCPPGAAEDVAERIVANSFQGLYVDANAISPRRSISIGEKLVKGGAAFVDGGIIGGPTSERDKTLLYLAGEEADRAKACFSAGPLGTRVIGDGIGKASSLKMCYAAHTKGVTALLGAILAAAETYGVREELENQWSRDDSDFAVQASRRVTASTAKAWRFIGEMQEIAATFEEAGMPPGFHAAAAEIYRRLAHLKNRPAAPPIAEVLTALQQAGKGGE